MLREDGKIECDVRPVECWSHYQGVCQRSASVGMTVLLADVGRFCVRFRCCGDITLAKWEALLYQQTKDVSVFSDCSHSRR